MALAEAAFEAGLNPFLCNVNHGLQNKAGDQALLVAQFAQLRGLDFEICTVDALAIQNGNGVEDGARKERYRLLLECAARHHLQLILTAHHAEDQAETILMHLSEGSGIIGLCGIPEQRGRFVRPWLHVTRPQILAYANSKHIDFVEDPTNSSTCYERNRVRGILPILSQATHKPFAEAASQSAELLRSSARALHWLFRPYLQMLQPLFAQLGQTEHFLGFRILNSELSQLPVFIQDLLFQFALDELRSRGRGRRIDLERLRVWLLAGQGRLMLGRDVVALHRGGALWLGRISKTAF